MKKKVYIILLLGLLSFMLNSPFGFATTHSEDLQPHCVQHKPTEALTISKGSDVYAAQFGNQITVPQVVSERTVRTYSFRSSCTDFNSTGRRIRHLTSFSKHSSWRIFPASTPFFCTTAKLFYVYALREIIR